VSDRVIEVDDASFEREVLGSPLPVLVEFWAPSCKPCRTVSPTLASIAREYAGRAKVVRVNTDVCSWLVSRFSLRGIPTVILFSGGQAAHSTVGVRPRGEYQRMLESAIDPFGVGAATPISAG
jgi:thioredoxin 1